MKEMIQLLDNTDMARISAMAFEIWPATYRDILSQEQINFMLKRNYTPTALAHSAEGGQLFYVLKDDATNMDLGFVSLKPRQNTLRIEKLYVMPEAQGKGVGSSLITFAEEKARQATLPVLELNVNRGNLKAYHFYLKQGFAVTDTVDIPYYGYVLDDYVMQKEI